MIRQYTSFLMTLFTVVVLFFFNLSWFIYANDRNKNDQFVIKGENKSCTLPSHLANRKIIFVSDDTYSPSHPYSNIISEIDFAKKSLFFLDLATYRSLVGYYSYKKWTMNLGVIKGRDQVGQKLVDYRLVLVCQSDFYGRYLFAQKDEETGRDIDQISGVYYLLDNNVID